LPIAAPSWKFLLSETLERQKQLSLPN